jgi:hypothetical protein
MKRGVLDIDAFGLETRPERIPMRAGRDQDDAFAIGERGRREATDGAIEKILILVQLHDVIARRRLSQNAIPRLRPVSVLVVSLHGLDHPY